MPQYMRQGYGKMLIDFSKYKERNSGNILSAVTVSPKNLTCLVTFEQLSLYPISACAEEGNSQDKVV